MRSLFRFLLGAGLLAFVLAAFAVQMPPSAPSHKPAPEATITPFYTPGKDASPVIPGAVAPRPSDPADSIAIDFKWKKGGFGSVALLDLTLTNGNSHAVKDIGVRCRFYGPSGTEIGRADRTIYEAIGSKGKKTVREVSFGFIDQQAAQASCEVRPARL